MASVDTSNNPNDPNNPNSPAINQPNQQTNQPATTGGAGGITATGAGNVTGQVVGTNNPSQPFQNIASYLSANAPQSQQLANQVAGTVSQPIEKAQTDITNTANDFTQSVNKGYTPENNPLISAVSQNPAFVVGENPQNVSNFKANLNDAYTGPTDFTQSPGYGNLESEISAAQAQANNTQNEAGIQTLLKSVEGPTTEGINKLDSLLLSANPENYQTIQNAGAGAANLLPTLNQTATDQNALAAQGSTNASKAAQDAAAALKTALGNETGNLTNEQNTIQGIVDEYNNSVGVINPVTQTIAQDIQNFLAANPQLSLSDATNALAPLMNLQNITMPTEATYASPVDYQTIAALASLGIDPAALSGLPINSGTANEAQTFQVPTALQDALGQAPGVESALNTELNTLGGQINTAISPFETAQSQSDQGRENFKAITGNINIYDPVTALNNPTLTDPTTGQQVPATIAQPNGTQAPNPAWQALAQQANQAVQLAESGDQAMQSVAPGLQWVNTAAPAYNDLIQAINDQLGKLGSVGAPTLTYGPNTVTDPLTGAPIGAPIGQKVATDIGKAANTAALAGTGAGAIGSGILAAGAGDIAAGEPLVAGLGAPAGVGAGLETAAATLPPAALAAYGTSNIAQNVAANPLQSGLMTLANTGLSLATLSLPPQIFNSIGSAINSVINDIGNFFGNLF